MAKSDIAQALDRLQGFAENLISYETNRRVQLAREKEDRVSDAYRYMIQNEESQIQEHQLAIDSVQQNLLDRGVELKSVKDEYRTIDSEELLSAANEGALEMLQVMLDDSKAQKESYESKAREANKVRRYVDMFDEAISLTDPAWTGEKHLIEASDVAQAAEDFKKAHKEYAPEIEQRLKELQTESQLEKLQTDYYAKLARESEEKITAATAEQMDATIKIKTLEDVKKETLEGVKAMTYQPVSSMVEQYRTVITRASEIQSGTDALTGKSLNTSEATAKQEEITTEYNRLGVILAPWTFSQDQAASEAQGIQTAITKAGNGNYQELINYFKKGHSQYILWTQENDQRAELYRSDMQSMFGIDIGSKEWVSQLEQLWMSVGQADIEQATEALKAGRQFLPDLPDESQTTIDPLLNEYGF